MDERRRDFWYTVRVAAAVAWIHRDHPVLTLALGIGANVAIFSVLNAMILRPPPGQSPGDFVELLFKFPGDPRLNQNFWWMDYERLRDERRVFSNLQAVSLDHRTFHTIPLAPEVVACMYMGGDFFDVLGIRPAIGGDRSGERAAWERPKARSRSSAGVLAELVQPRPRVLGTSLRSIACRPGSSA